MMITPGMNLYVIEEMKIVKCETRNYGNEIKARQLAFRWSSHLLWFQTSDTIFLMQLDLNTKPSSVKIVKVVTR